jgi:uncharacterized membrane protein YdjX (TVP38/TMEM64 family)
MIKQNKKIILFILLIAVIMLVRYSLIGELLSIENVKQYRNLLLTTVHDHYALSAVSFITAYVAVTALSIPGAAILTLAGGFLFGLLPTTLYVNMGATTGATLAFLAARYLFGNWLQTKYQEQLSRFNDEMQRNGAGYLLTLRLVPVFPFFLINILSGFTNVPLRTFVWTTALGIVPGTVVYAYAGRQIGTINAPSDILSARVIIAFAVLALFALFPALLDRFKIMKKRS